MINVVAPLRCRRGPLSEFGFLVYRLALTHFFFKGCVPGFYLMPFSLPLLLLRCLSVAFPRYVDNGLNTMGLAVDSESMKKD